MTWTGAARPRRSVSGMDWQEAGFGIRVAIAVKVRNQHRHNVQLVLEHRNINNSCRVNNNFDYFFEAIFASIKELEAFTDKLRSLKVKTKMFFIVDTLQEEFLFTEKEHLKLL